MHSQSSVKLVFFRLIVCVREFSEVVRSHSQFNIDTMTMTKNTEFNNQIFQIKKTALKSGSVRWKAVSKFPCTEIKSPPSVVPFRGGFLAVNFIREPGAVEDDPDYKGTGREGGEI